MLQVAVAALVEALVDEAEVVEAEEAEAAELLEALLEADAAAGVRSLTFTSI